MDTDRIRGACLAGIERLQFTKEIPVIHRIRTTREGRILVPRSGPRTGRPGPIDLIPPTSAYMGTIPAGRFAPPAAFASDGVTALMKTDELDLPREVVGRATLRSP